MKSFIFLFSIMSMLPWMLVRLEESRYQVMLVQAFVTHAQRDSLCETADVLAAAWSELATAGSRYRCSLGDASITFSLREQGDLLLLRTTVEKGSWLDVRERTRDQSTPFQEGQGTDQI